MTIFERLDALEATVNGLNTDISNLTRHLTSVEETVEEILNAEEDTGWIDLTLASGVEAYNSGQTPKYRKIGKIVFIRGAVKNIQDRDTTIATLPVGFRPASISYPYVQNTSIRTGNFAMFSRMIVGTDGRIRLEAISDGAAYGNKWFPITCSFVIE